MPQTTPLPDTRTTVLMLAALAQDTRLSIFKLLVQAGAEGVAAGEIAERLGVPGATLSFHLKNLTQAGLAVQRQQSRFIYYTADFNAMNGLLTYLTDQCCSESSPTENPSSCATSLASALK